MLYNTENEKLLLSTANTGWVKEQVTEVYRQYDFISVFKKQNQLPCLVMQT